MQQELPWKARALARISKPAPKKEPVQVPLLTWRRPTSPPSAVQLELMLCLSSPGTVEPAGRIAISQEKEPVRTPRVPAKMRAARVKTDRRVS